MPNLKSRPPTPAGRPPDTAGNGDADGRDRGNLMPLDFMLTLLRDTEASLDDRKWAAYHAAPYCHPRLSPVEAERDAWPRFEDVLETLR